MRQGKRKSKTEKPTAVEVGNLLAPYLGIDPWHVDLRRLPIADILALMSKLKSDYLNARKLRDESRQRCSDYSAEQECRTYRAAIWECQVQINQHNAFMRKQYTLENILI